MFTYCYFTDSKNVDVMGITKANTRPTIDGPSETFTGHVLVDLLFDPSDEGDRTPGRHGTSIRSERP